MSAANEYLRTAVELARKGDLQAALAEVKRALRGDPGHEKGLIFRFTLEARLLRRERRFGDAAVRYHAVLALDPENREARQMLREAASAGAFGDNGGNGATQSQPAPAEPADAPQPGQTPGNRELDYSTMPPPGAAADEQQVALGTSQGAARGSSSGPPMVEVVTLRKTRRTGPITLSLKDSPASPSAVAPPSANFAAASVTSASDSEPPFVTVSSDSDPPLVTLDGSAEADDTSGDFMAEDLPPPSVETPLEPERRIARRVAIEVNVGVSSESNFFTGFSGDISEGGLFIATYHHLPVGAHVHVSFGVMGREIKCDAVVCWIRDPIDINVMPGFGVRFGEMSDEDHAAIHKFIVTRAPMFYDDD